LRGGRNGWRKLRFGEKPDGGRELRVLRGLHRSQASPLQSESGLTPPFHGPDNPLPQVMPRAP
jgi:hypothetical protein